VTKPIAKVEDEVTEPIAKVEDEVTEPIAKVEDEVTKPIAKVEDEVTEPIAKVEDEVTEPIAKKVMNDNSFGESKEDLSLVLDLAQEKTQEMEQKNDRKPASLRQENVQRTQNFYFDNKDKANSKNSLAFISAMIPKPANIDKYEYTDPPIFKDSDYGRGLVYNCLKKHWACVNKASYFKCRDHAKWSLAKKKVPKCVINSIHVDLKSCSTSQLIRINALEEADFCDGAFDREPAASVEISEEDISYEEGL
ncbi:MAG: hypothetical protein HN576_06110, partial [Bacteriovoracaceae bacterium]|nr:hypothetical protein [Bacteriovoracaceae bacterium]